MFVLEDDADIARLIQHHLEAAGFPARIYATPANLISDAERQAIVDRAHRDGGLRPDVTALDISWLIEQFARNAPPADASDEDRDVQQRLLAIAIDGLYATGAPPLPGHPPTSQHYEQRWQSPQAPE